MSYIKNLSYRDIPFTSETPQEDFFIFDEIKNLHTKCEYNKEKILKIRTLGILNNDYGQFYLREITTKHKPFATPDPKKCIQVSLVYMNKLLKSPSMPHPVQIFGLLQWKKHPVIFAQIIQPLSVSAATLLNETMLRMSSKHLATTSKYCPSTGRKLYSEVLEVL